MDAQCTKLHYTCKLNMYNDACITTFYLVFYVLQSFSDSRDWQISLRAGKVVSAPATRTFDVIRAPSSALILPCSADALQTEDVLTRWYQDRLGVLLEADGTHDIVHLLQTVDTKIQTTM